MSEPPLQLFPSRQHAGERLWFQLPRLEAAVVIVAMSDGALEVAAAVAVLEHAPLHRLPLVPGGPRRLHGVQGAAVLLVDDGLLPAEALVAASRAARSGGAAKLLLLVPVVARAASLRLVPEVTALLCDLSVHRLAPGTEIYPRPPLDPAAARALLREVNGADRAAEGAVRWAP